MDLSPLAYALLTAAGFAAGFVDAIAGGGGIISVPALLAAGVPAHLALGTNKLQASMGTTLAAANYRRSGLLVPSQLPVGVACTALGAFCGAFVVTRLRSDWLDRVMPLLLGAVLLYVVLSPRFGGTSGRQRLSFPAFSVAVGLTLGFYDGFFGPGTGSFWTLAFVSLLGFALPQATANTKAMNLTSNVVSLAWFGAQGKVAWSLGLAIGVANVAGALLGSSLAIVKGAPLIRGFLLLVVAATIARLLWRNMFG
jgi:uncharacterized membrane protein YfcA